MKNNLSRLMFCVAALDLAEREFYELLRELRKAPEKELWARLGVIQNLMEHAPSIEHIMPLSLNMRISPEKDASLGERVEKLLKTEAGLSTSEAVGLLTAKLVDMKLIAAHLVPPLSRKSLGSWAIRVSQNVAPKDILRCATILRNEHAHTPIKDWVLGGSKK